MVLTACASSGGFSPAGRTQATRVSVHNEHWERLTIYLERDGTLLRLGEVDGMDSAVLRVPNEYLASHRSQRLVAMEVGRVLHVASEYFDLNRGERAEWTTGPMNHPTPVVVIQPGWE